MLRIPCVQKVTNNGVLQCMSKQKELLRIIKERKIKYLGQVLRGESYELLQIVFEGQVEGKRSVGRRQNSWLKDLRSWFDLSHGWLGKYEDGEVTNSFLVLLVEFGYLISNWKMDILSFN
uniref:Uncharacterized protein LOC114332069 isoform X2 n=1 Tax=Diabrotica virgifera virgifera TaxID=50390 RepID=A0A6P7FYF4_DIAVI